MLIRGIRRALTIAGLAALTLLGAVVTPAAASPFGGFAASCSSASNVTEYWWTGMSWDSFKTKDSAYFSQGLRLVQLDIDGNGITAVWQPGSGTQWVRWGMSTDSFKAWDQYYFNQGLRLVEVDRDGGDWAAVWRPGSGAQYWRSGIPSWLDFKNQDQVYFNQGLRLVDVIIIANDNITAVWRGDQGNAGQLWQSGIPATGADENNESDFQRINRLRRQAGWELRILKTHPNDAYVMGVWRYRGGSFNQMTNVYHTQPAMHNMEIACRAQGMHLVSMDVH